MLNDLTIASTSAHNNGAQQEINENEDFRDIHALAPPPSLPPPNAANRARRREAWETSSLQSTSSGENFTTMSREFSALVLAGSAIAGPGAETDNDNITAANDNSSLLARIGEDEYDAPPEEEIETNPLAIVADHSGGVSVGPPAQRSDHNSLSFSSFGVVGDETVTLQRVKKEEVETKISAWQNAKVAKINNRFKREDAVISGWESEQVHKATSWMKKVERKLEEKRARALEKMQNDVAKARRKAEERRASAEATRGTKVARILEITNLMRAVGRPPVKRSFF